MASDKKSNPLHRLGSYAHPKGGYTKAPVTNINHSMPPKAQTEKGSPSLGGKSGDKGKHSRMPGQR